jgi:hypothetical protein
MARNMAAEVAEAEQSIRRDVDAVQDAHVIGPNAAGDCPVCMEAWPCPPARVAQWLRRIVLERS